MILFLSLTAQTTLTDEDVAEESNLAIELKKEVYKTHDFQLKVFVLTNPELKLQGSIRLGIRGRTENEAKHLLEKTALIHGGIL